MLKIASVWQNFTDTFFLLRLRAPKNPVQQNNSTYKTKRISDLKQDQFELSKHLSETKD